MKPIAVAFAALLALLAPHAHAGSANGPLCSQAAMELYVFQGDPLTDCYLPRAGREHLETLRLRYVEKEHQYRERMAELDRRMAELDQMQRALDAMPDAPTPAAPYVDSYTAPFADRPFRTCRVYPGAGVDCTGF